MNRLLVAGACIALISLFAVRIAAPSDLYHQTQPKTVSYTTDIIANGNWILPIEHGEIPATKPLLYNWIAVPFVKAFGYSSDWAHKMPSIIALLLTFVLIVWLGERVVRSKEAGSKYAGLGFLAGLMLVSTYPMFKLGYLARPDMVLTLWLIVGWASATAILVMSNEEWAEKKPLALLLVFWGSLALGWLTKGPAAIVPLAYAIVGAKFVAGRFRAINRFQWWWGIPASLLPFALWLIAVYSVSPTHVTQTLWYDEFYGRLIGEGSEGSDEGSWGLLKRAFHMPWYYIARNAPWSVLSILAMFALWGNEWKKQTSVKRIWLHAAAVWVILVILFFTPAANKRADYIASAFPIGALLASWWWLDVAKAAVIRYGAPILAAVTVMTAMTIVEFRETQAPEPGHGEAIESFIMDARAKIETDPIPVIFWQTGLSHLQAYLGFSMKDDTDSLRQAISTKDSFWLLAGKKNDDAKQPSDLQFIKAGDVILTKVLESEVLSAGRSWPGQVVLWKVESKE